MTEISRKDFLKLVGVGGAAYALNACVPRPVQKFVESLNTSAKTELNPIEASKESDVKIKFGDERPVNLPSLAWVPDTHTSYIKNPDGSFSYYMAAGTEGFVLEGSDLYHLGNPRKIISPSHESSDYGINGYRAPGSVFKDNQGNIWSFDHIEEWANANNGNNFTGRIGISKSEDNGQTFKDKGVIINGMFTKKAGEKVTGAGQPCVIQKNENGVDFIYLYYTEWSQDKHFIALARAPLSQIDNPDAWQKYNHGNFETTGKGGECTPVIEAPPNEVYAALVSVSWNNYLEKNLAVLETSNGFWLTISRDSVNWENYQKIAEFPQAHDKKVDGSTWFSYPTLLSEETGNQFITDKEGYLIYSRGIVSEPHFMVSRKFNIG